MEIFCTFIWDKEREKNIESFAKHEPCVILLCAIDHFILKDRRPWVSKHQKLCGGEICLKEIVSNTRLDLNHSSFMHLVCKLLIICRSFFFYKYNIYLLLCYHIFLCYCLFLDMYIVLLINHSWYKPKNLKADFRIYFNLFLWLLWIGVNYCARLVDSFLFMILLWLSCLIFWVYVYHY